MFDFMKIQHSCTLDPAELVVDKCSDIKFIKDNIFAIFNEAVVSSVARSVE